MSNTFVMKAQNVTMTLNDCLRRCKSYDEFERIYGNEFLEDNMLGKALNTLVGKYGKVLRTVSEEAGYNGSYLSSVINGKKHPTRDAVIAFCTAMGATFDETQDVLKCGGMQPLYVRRKRDVIIWYGIMKRESLGTIDENLEARGFVKLSGKHEIKEA